MHRARVHRVIATAAAALLALQVLAPTMSAAQANWTMVITPQQTNAAVGSDVAFLVEISNGGPSNIAQLYFVDLPETAAKHAAPSQGSCVISPDLTCSLGALNAGSTASILVVYGPVSGSAFQYRGAANSNGATFSDRGKNSRGDSLFYPEIGQDPLSVALCSGKDCAGGFLLSGGNVSNDTALHRTKNRQSTSLIGIAPGTGAYVQDGTGVTYTCGSSCQSTFYGEWSKVIVGRGTAQDVPFKIVLTMVGSFNSLDLDTVRVTHVLDDGTVQIIGDITAEQCPGYAGTSALPSPEGCLSAAVVGGNLQVTVWVQRNGGFRA